MVTTYLLPFEFLPHLEHDTIRRQRNTTGEVRVAALGGWIVRHGVASVGRADQLRADHQSAANI